jgi:hypothetical protein
LIQSRNRPNRPALSRDADAAHDRARSANERPRCERHAPSGVSGKKLEDFAIGGAAKGSAVKKTRAKRKA